jgi:AraC-like DNA-binding protein
MATTRLEEIVTVLAAFNLAVHLDVTLLDSDGQKLWEAANVAPATAVPYLLPLYTPSPAPVSVSRAGFAIVTLPLETILPGHVVVIGPWADPERHTAREAFLKALPPTLRRNAAELISSIPPFGTEEFIASIYLLALSLGVVPEYIERLNSLVAGAIPDFKQEGSQESDDEQNRDERLIVETRYAMEARLRRAIAAGDMKALHDLVLQGRSALRLPNRFPNQPTRSEKNLTITLGTIMRIAAIDGGLHPLIVHALSSKFALAIEKARGTGELDSIRMKMATEYCESVSRLASGPWSKAIRRTADTIRLNPGREHSLMSLASDAATSPAYLSRRFREETGMTITEFTSRTRVAEASRLLESADDPITSIAHALGFSDAGYFSRVFFRFTGERPSDFRRRVRA